MQSVADVGPSDSVRYAGRALAWLVAGVLVLLCALTTAGGAAWLMIGVITEPSHDDSGLLAYAGLLLALIALSTGGLGWLAIDRSRNHYSSRKRYYFLSPVIRDPDSAKRSDCSDRDH